jgi:AbrB family looped-hinge helix DNA binding protein
MTATTNSPQSIRMGRQGRIVIPAEIREELGLQEGDQLVARVEEGVLHMSTYRQNLARLRKLIQESKPEGVDLLAEFYAERRRDAAKEDDER